MLIMFPLVGGMAFMGGAGGESILGIAVIGLYYLLTIIVTVMFGKRRLNDLDRSGWWLLLFIVPLVNLALAIYMMFFSGTDGENRYGAPAAPNSTGVKVIFWIVLGIPLVGLLAAILLPALVG